MTDATEAIRIRLLFEAEQAEKAAKRMERQLLALEGRYDPLANATKRLDRDQKLLNAALNAGKIDAQRYAAMMDNVQQEFAETEARLNGLTAAYDRNSAAALSSARTLNGAATAQTANLTAQLNDIGVMLAAGQNPLQLAVQQGTQINQVFAQMGGGVAALRGIGAALVGMINPISVATIGIIALGGYGVKALLGLREEAITLADRIDAVSKALDEQAASADAAGQSSEDLRRKYGAFANVMQGTLDLLSTTAAAEAQRQIDGLSKSLADLLGTAGAGEGRAELASFFDVNIGLAFTDAARKAREEARGLTSEFQNAQAALAASNGDIDQQIVATRTLLENAVALANATDGVSTAESELIGNLTAALDVMIKQKAAVAEIPPSLYAAYEGYQALRIEGEAASKSAQDLLSSLDAQAEMQATILAYGRDSAEVASLRADRERETFEATLASMDASEAMKNELRLAFTVAQDLTAQADATAGRLGSASGAAAGLSGSIAQASGFAAELVARLGQVPAGIAAIAGQVDGAISALKQQNASLTYQIEQGITATAAGIKAQRDQIVEYGLAQGLSIDQVAELTTGISAQADEAEGLAREQERLNKTLSDQAAAAAKAASAVAGGGGGGGGRSGGGGGLAGATREAAAAAREQEKAVEAARKILEDYDRQVEETARANAALAASWAQTFTDAALSGDLSGAFSRLGRDSRSAFFDALGSGQSLSGILTGGLSGIQAGFAAGGLSGIGGALSAAMPLIGGISTVVGLLRGFSSSEIVGQGIRGGIGGAQSYADNFTLTERSSFWGLRSRTSDDFDRNSELTGLLRTAATGVKDEVRSLAEGLGGAASNLSAVSTQFDIDTRGMDAEGVQQALTQEIEAYRERVAQAALGTTKFSQLGENATATLARLTGSLSTYNDVQRVLGMETLPASIASAARAAEVLKRAGGAQSLGAGASSYFQNILGRDEQQRLLNDQMNAALDRIDINRRLITDEASFQAQYEALMQRGHVARAGELLALAPLFSQLEQLRDARRAEAQAMAAADLSTRQSIQQRIWQLTGNVAAQREFEARGLSDLARAMLERVHALEDANLAEQRAAAVLSERMGLQRQIWDLQGNEAAIRADVLSELDESNRAMQRQVWALQDQRDAEDEAAEAAQRATDALRDLMNAIDPATFSDRFSYEEAVGRATRGLDVPLLQDVPIASATTNGQQAAADLSGEVRALRNEVRAAREANVNLGLAMNSEIAALRANSDFARVEGVRVRGVVTTSEVA